MLVQSIGVGAHCEMFEMSCVPELNCVYVRVIKARRPEYIVYDDEFQVVAEPFADLVL